MAITIQPARPEQLPELVQLLTKNQLPVEDLPVDLPNFWLALDGEKLVGSVGFEIYNTVGLLRSLSVDETYRNQAIARQLCDRAFDEAKKQAVSTVYLITTTADRYFQRLGFSLVDRSTVPDAIMKTSQFSSLCPSSATVMKQTYSV
ncbi:arsenic resistance N-acetyltransferase ArsN2 [Spirosoma spitsbergense]|uniref:arsenic resistance N-acetyltransferase ArsN2 n=1 Tax=Spirosoma spitsbergense TaxID=431554 RepID=UPI00035EC8FE|nr:arsenic resistance N-acetyltransferase ArsN2 [Spirosoma spitsbergense]